MSTTAYNRDIEQAAIVAKTARITGLSKRHVRRVIIGEYQNETVLSIYMLFQEGNEALLQRAAEMSRQIRKHSA